MALAGIAPENSVNRPPSVYFPCRLTVRLNPAEGIWEHLRENHFANQALASLDEVEELLCQAFRKLILNPELVRLITNHSWLNALGLTAN